jgi:hypothetical protein
LWLPVFTSLSDTRARLFLVEALDLVATYLAGPNVSLAERSVGVARSLPDDADEVDKFLAELRARHALACAARLRPIVERIERRVSDSASILREESRGVIRGRLNVPHYIARRVTNVSLPRTYPILVVDRPPETPENAVVVQALSGVGLELGAAPFARASAEGRDSALYYGWLRSRLHRWPWDSVKRRDVAERLVREVDRRVRRRQTGNDTAYADLIPWSREWWVDPRRLGALDREDLALGIVAFPPGDPFWERVFEIWCLKEVAASILRNDIDTVDGPLPLAERKRGPIYRFNYGGEEIQIWFQRQKPLGSGRWSYLGSSLAGIPDIIATSRGKAPLVVDAKYRMMATDTRSEETYKMLGYAENFRSAYSEVGFRGLLLFPGTQSRATTLSGPNGGRLDLIAIEPLQARPAAERALDKVVHAWLE